MGRISSIVALVIWAVAPCLVVGQAPADALLEKVIKAHYGSVENMAKLQYFTSKATGKIHQADGNEMPTERRVFASPAGYRLEMTLGIGSAKVDTVAATNAKSSWRMRMGQMAEALSTGDDDTIRLDSYALHGVVYLTACREPDTTVMTIPGQKIADRPCVGFRVSRRGYAPIFVWVDDSTFLVAKVAYRGKEAGIDVVKEFYTTEHKDFGGIKLHTQEALHLSGKKLNTTTITDYAFPKSLDPTLFEQPKGK